MNAPTQGEQAEALARWKQAEALMQRGQLAEARLNYGTLAGGPLEVPARLRLSVIASRAGDLRGATDEALAAFRAGTPEPELLEALAARLFALGESEAFQRCAGIVERSPRQSIPVLAEFGRMLVSAGQPAAAVTLLQRARGMGLDTPATRYLEAVSLLQCGRMEEAEAGLEACIRMRPDFARAHWALAKLRRQTPASNHVARLEALLASGSTASPEDLPALCFALFKELDDLDEPERAWDALARGCVARRQLVEYDGAAEAILFERLRTTCSGRFFDTAAGDPPPGPMPIFIIGLPRSGTTLLERILGNHSAVADAGELRDFPWQMRWVANLPGPARLDLPLLERSAGLDYDLLGRRYLEHARFHAGGRAFFTDKLPPNFIHAGFIRRALPGARMLHMVRDPMDVCFSNLKELFAAAYPYSYDLMELADHYGRYRRLMAHWHRQMPGAILDIRYAELVADPEATMRKVFDFCGLAWEEGCLEIERRATPVTTASSTQVRESIHAGALGSWQRYARQLEPLRQRLQDDGWL
jgi:tetratricopeptide (TPR) repeat protein